MLYDVDVVCTDNEQQIILFTALIYAESVTECWNEANTLLRERNIERESVRFDVEEVE